MAAMGAINVPPLPPSPPPPSGEDGTEKVFGKGRTARGLPLKE